MGDGCGAARYRRDRGICGKGRGELCRVALLNAGYLPRHVDAMGDSVIRAGATSPSAVRVLTAQPDGDPFVDDDELDDDDFRDGWGAEDPGLIGLPPDPVESAGAAAARLVAGLWPA